MYALLRRVVLSLNESAHQTRLSLQTLGRTRGMSCRENWLVMIVSFFQVGGYVCQNHLAASRDA
jgi:hypothetical protein